MRRRNLIYFSNMRVPNLFVFQPFEFCIKIKEVCYIMPANTFQEMSAQYH